MKKLALAAAAVSVMAATPVFAGETASKDFEIKASVPSECSLEKPANINFDIDIDRSAGPDALLMTASESNTQQFWMSCNYGALITVDAGQLVNAAGAAVAANDANDFTNVLVYDLALENQDKTGAQFSKIQMKVSSDQTKSTTPGGAFHENANLGIQIKTVNNPKRPVAGDYTAVTTISLGAV
ncbi:hypothetical protein [Qipengyuania sp. JC766]|uniref:hypothetical protein n=1 Tax=Qipengyuania sp. JC766 TaxID=3232139 RepID=UPI003457B48A